DYLTKPFTIDQLRARLIAAERVSALHRDLQERHAEVVRAAEERGRLLQRLERERSRLESVIDHMPAGVLIVGAPEGDILMANERVGQMWPASVSPPRSVWDLAPS